MKKLVAKLKENFGERLYSVVVYGSIARGTWRRDSDIDLLVIIEGLPKSRLKRQSLFMQVEEKLSDELERLWQDGYHHDFSPIIKTPEEARRLSPLYLDMVEDAVILYDKNNFFHSILARLKKKLQELGAKRVYIGNKWIWDLKPDYKWGEVIQIE